MAISQEDIITAFKGMSEADQSSLMVSLTSNMTVMSIVKAVKQMEEEFGVSAAAPVAVAAAPASKPGRTGTSAPGPTERRGVSRSSSNGPPHRDARPTASGPQGLKEREATRACSPAPRQGQRRGGHRRISRRAAEADERLSGLAGPADPPREGVVVVDALLGRRLVVLVPPLLSFVILSISPFRPSSAPT